VTLRAYSAVPRFEAKARAKIDRNTSFFFHSFAVNRWLGWRLELVGALTLLVAAGLALLLADVLGPALVGLSVTSSLGLSGNLNWMVRQISELEGTLWPTPLLATALPQSCCMHSLFVSSVDECGGASDSVQQNSV
jgi:hypothetical protein